MTKQRLLETSENPDSNTISAEQIRRAARTSTYVFLLHLRSLENAKNVERERERDETLSLFSQSDRVVYLGTIACLREFFFSQVPSLWISSPLRIVLR